MVGKVGDQRHKDRELLIAVGEEVRDHRMRLGLSQRQLAERMGLSASGTISNVETAAHAATLDNFVRVCEALEVPAWVVLQAAMGAVVVRQTRGKERHDQHS